MANFLANTKFGGGAQMNFFQHRFYGGNTYFHYKTNLQLSTFVMVTIEAVGYAYGANQAIRSAWNFYSYIYLVHGTVQNYYGGMSAHGVYVSSDNYVCIRASCAPYYSGWSFNAYTQNPTGYNTTVSFLASVQTDNGGNYY